jgi:hypothetical protein
VAAYTKAGRLKVEVGTPIYECNSRCLCKEDCVNRVVQRGSKVLELINICKKKKLIFFVIAVKVVHLPHQQWQRVGSQNYGTNPKKHIRYRVCWRGYNQ